MAHFCCPNCGEMFQMNWIKWMFTTLFHWFNFKEWKDYRKTKCPCCGKKSYMRKW